MNNEIIKKDPITIPALKLTQPIGDFYVGVIPSKDLLGLCTTDMDSIKESEYDIYQRKLNQSRIPALEQYMEYSKATFPNGIILNSRYPLKYENGKLIIERKQDAFFIIDGQHRVEALSYYKGQKPFDVCIVVFEKLDEDTQTEIFVTVNSEQKKVNPTVRLNLKGNDFVDTPEKVIRKIAIAMNDEPESPLRGKINFSDDSISKKDNKLSLAAFMRPILKKMYNEEKSFEIKDILIQNGNNRLLLSNYIKDGKRTRPLWEMYINSDDDILYMILVNFFTAVKDVFPDDWENADSLLLKTSGYDALIMLLCEMLEKSNNDMSYDTLYEQLLKLQVLSGTFTLEKIGVGNSAAVKLFHKFEDILYLERNNKENIIEFFDVD